MGWSTDDIPDQRGRIALVTGANGGLGLETARELARKGAHVIIAARNQQKAAAARLAIVRDVAWASLDVREVDLGVMDSVRQMADSVLADHERVDLLINNAGIMATHQERTVDGFDKQLAVNHLGHFVLTAMLAPVLLRAPAARVVSVSSTARFFAQPLNGEDPHLQSGYSPWRSYGQSKWANLHFAQELNRRLEAAGATARSLAAHPGFTHTELQKQSVAASDGAASQRFFHRLVRWFGMQPLGGALPQLRAATDPEVVGGSMYAPRWGTAGPPVARGMRAGSRDPEVARTLWEVSENETGVSFDVAAIAQHAAR